jgi:ribosome maturation factor RimP
MGPIELRLMDLIEPTVAAMGYELVGVEYLGQGQHSRLRVFIDQPDGISLDDCEQVSRQVSAVLDVEDPIRGQYALEVSSPGLDRPLFKLEHFARFVGHQVKLRLRQARMGQRNFKGQIVAVIEGSIELALDDGDVIKLAYTDVDKANLVPEFV